MLIQHVFLFCFDFWGITWCIYKPRLISFHLYNAEPVEQESGYMLIVHFWGLSVISIGLCTFGQGIVEDNVCIACRLMVHWQYLLIMLCCCVNATLRENQIEKRIHL